MLSNLFRLIPIYAPCKLLELLRVTTMPICGFITFRDFPYARIAYLQRCSQVVLIATALAVKSQLVTGAPTYLSTYLSKYLGKYHLGSLVDSNCRPFTGASIENQCFVPSSSIPWVSTCFFVVFQLRQQVCEAGGGQQLRSSKAGKEQAPQDGSEPRAPGRTSVPQLDAS